VSAAVLVAVLVAGGTYLVLQRGLVRVTLGFVLLGHAANVLLLAGGGMARRQAPLVGEVDPGVAADPLPQAFALTAIVITFGITVYLFGLAGAGADEEPERMPGDEPTPAGPGHGAPADQGAAVPASDDRGRVR
jgi:multicomponent Na+:H+ antiporter subunit C